MREKFGNIDFYAAMLEYESPIKILMQEMLIQREEQIGKAVLSSCTKIGVDVDKKELLKALSYDRGQYEKGYKAAKREIVQCKNCMYFAEDNPKNHQGICNCGEKFTNYGAEFYPFADDFCSYGEEMIDYDI